MSSKVRERARRRPRTRTAGAAATKTRTAAERGRRTGARRASRADWPGPAGCGRHPGRREPTAASSGYRRRRRDRAQPDVADAEGVAQVEQHRRLPEAEHRPGRAAGRLHFEFGPRKPVGRAVPSLRRTSTASSKGWATGDARSSSWPAGWSTPRPTHRGTISSTAASPRAPRPAADLGRRRARHQAHRPRGAGAGTIRARLGQGERIGPVR